MKPYPYLTWEEVQKEIQGMTLTGRFKYIEMLALLFGISDVPKWFMDLYETRDEDQEQPR